GVRADLGRAYLRVGVLERESGRSKGASAALGKARELFEPLCGGDRPGAGCVSDLAAVHAQLSELHADARRWEDARAAQEKRAELVGRLLDLQPDDKVQAARLANAHLRLGEILLAAGRQAEALKRLQAAREELGKLPRAPGAADKRHELARAE